MDLRLYNQDVIRWLDGWTWMIDNGFSPKAHAVLCDPPYALTSISRRWSRAKADPTTEIGKRMVRGFMGQNWDGFDSPSQFESWVTAWGSRLLNVVHPAAYGLFFGGSRTYHRLAVGLENAGWEIVDCIMWLYGTGYPKNHHVKLDGWEGYGSALKPGYEPIVVARAPRQETFAQCATKYGSGALNIDGARIEAIDSQLAEKYNSVRNADERTNTIYGKDRRRRSEQQTDPHPDGRHPANVILDADAAQTLAATNPGAERYFYTAKAPTWEREAGLSDRTPQQVNDGRKKDIDNPFQRGTTERRNTHPTVKPIALTEYLARLILPPDVVPDRHLLIPFSGVGSEVIGAMFAGWDRVTGIELSADYIDQARARMAWWSQFDSYAAATADDQETQDDPESDDGWIQLGFLG